MRNLPAREHGLTLLEVVLSVGVFSVAALGLASSMYANSQLNRANRENTLAECAARGMIESMRNEEFAEIFARFNGDPNDDPEGIGTAPGPDFPVPGLIAPAGDPDGRPGRIDFPSVNGQLREDVSIPDLQMPRDLNGDQVIDGFNHAGDYRFLPVTITIQWQSPGDSRAQVVRRTAFVPK